jgi:hypothetical protein
VVKDVKQETRGRKPKIKKDVDTDLGKNSVHKGHEDADGDYSSSAGHYAADNIDQQNSKALQNYKPTKDSIFADQDMSKFNIYEKYYKILSSLIMHKEVYDLE